MVPDESADFHGRVYSASDAGRVAVRCVVGFGYRFAARIALRPAKLHRPPSRAEFHISRAVLLLCGKYR
jgi:hypothetical protein